MEGEGHDTVGRPEGLLDTITMVYIYIDIKDPWVMQEELEDGEHDIVNVAESRGL